MCAGVLWAHATNEDYFLHLFPVNFADDSVGGRDDERGKACSAH